MTSSYPDSHSNARVRELQSWSHTSTCDGSDLVTSKSRGVSIVAVAVIRPFRDRKRVGHGLETT